MKTEHAAEATENGIACGAVDQHGELELILTVDGTTGSIFISHEFWEAVGWRFETQEQGQSMNLNELRNTSYEIAKSKGWHDADAPLASLSDRCALIISELSEALEEYRSGVAPHQVYFREAGASAHMVAQDSKQAHIWATEGKKPEGIAIELADVCIRIGDLAGRYELDLNRVRDSRATIVNWSEPEEDLGIGCEVDQKSFSDWLMVGTHLAVSAWMERTSDDRPSDETTRHLILLTFTMFKMAEVFEIDLEAAIQIKHAFNRTRSYRHGGKKI